MKTEPGEHSRISEYTMDWVTEECVSIYIRNERWFCSPEQPERL